MPADMTAVEEIDLQGSKRDASMSKDNSPESAASARQSAPGSPGFQIGQNDPQEAAVMLPAPSRRAASMSSTCIWQGIAYGAVDSGSGNAGVQPQQEPAGTHQRACSVMVKADRCNNRWNNKGQQGHAFR